MKRQTGNVKLVEKFVDLLSTDKGELEIDILVENVSRKVAQSDFFEIIAPLHFQPEIFDDVRRSRGRAIDARLWLDALGRLGDGFEKFRRRAARL